MKLLNLKKIEYLLVGGYAVAFYGYPRATADIDIWIATNKENARRMVNALSEFGLKGSEVKESVFLQPGKMIRMGFPPVRIEILTEISGVKFKTCFARRIETKIDGIKVNIISKPDLLKNKKASGRHKDLDDLENLNF